MISKMIGAVREYFNGGPEEPDGAPDPAPGETEREQPAPDSEPSGKQPVVDLPQSDLVSAFERRAVEDALRHEEDLFVQPIPIIAEVRAMSGERFAALRAWASERCLGIQSELAAVALNRERAEQIRSSAEAALVRRGVPDGELALPADAMKLKRAAALVASVLLLGLAIAMQTTELDPGSSVIPGIAALAAVGLLVVAALAGDVTRKLRKVRADAIEELDELTRREGDLHRELDGMPETVLDRAQVEAALPARLVTAYRSTARRALPPGALSEPRKFEDESLPEVEIPEWALSYEPVGDQERAS